MLENIFDILTSPSLSFKTMAFRIVLSTIAGFVIGFERKIHLQSAGLRTHILICLSATVMMLTSLYIPQVYAPGRGDPTRIAAQIVSGVGFLGGGAILHQGLNIRGLNSAATVWTAAGIGMAIGCGMIVIAFLALIISNSLMFSLEHFEQRYFPAEHIKHLELIYKNDMINMKSLNQELKKHGLIVTNVDFSKELSEQQIRIIYTVKVPHNLDIPNLLEGIKNIGALDKVKLKN
ncbi:MAG: MgtC/SapB family protein [Treponema sp.]|jgi:putative Mg2+ transporter-C (MgtC) family protein|nr:MgtC/SapB family protein [Treponema sp.]